ncbi:gap junction delta-4 protein [Cheilinus undulatus]|uniref:gap junction delta-4 protein n=1 Tax=Cheilinus undulatus TaxID=241271 RepID=UPI001BD61E21|nr:gap junction delta-4 protein [Cheilinus undulatus]
MAGSNASEVIFISVNHSITLMGKVWLIVMIFLRVLILLFAGYPLYQDEQERFVCNTIQPGCANVCYDLFSPISLFRFWLVQLVTLCLPYFIFIIYVVHKVSNGLTLDLVSDGQVKAFPFFKIHQESKPNMKKTPLVTERRSVQSFTGAYIIHLMFRTLLEAGFGAAHYYLFGFHIPRRFLCQHPPCTTQVDCYISRPTEKTVMLNFMLAVAALSLFLNVLDFICAIKRSVKQKGNKKMLVERIYEEEQCFLSAAGGASKGADPNAAQARQDVEVEAGPLGCNTNGNNGYSIPQEEAPERNGSEVALCPPEPMGTPRSIRVSKRSRLKPPPPPRRDLGTSLGGSTAPAADVSIKTCTRRVGQYTLVELSSSPELQTNEDGQEKRSEWV